MNKWSKKSLVQYDTCHEDLQIVANEVLKIHDCSFLQGHRDEETQNKYYDKGTSKVRFPESKHNKMPSRAMDLAPYKSGDNPYDMENVLYFAGVVMAVADNLYNQGMIGHRLRWGGTWHTKVDAVFAFNRGGFFDGIHFELEDS